ncbi:MAG: isoleucine--tRNA ligase [Planctomycetes bacterium]|nr:isoleucine--tRNA ligase [Planctomycetota bacterium]
MFQKVSPNPDLIAGEHAVLKFWRESDAFETLRRRCAGKPPWSFLDGPITANNPMGVHHAWGRTYKDCYQRYFAMAGHDLRWQNGFDCQGLWVEVEVEREMGFRSKRDIELYGLEAFIEQCKARVDKFARIQTEQSIRLGYWMDWDREEDWQRQAGERRSYFTMSDENNYTIWAFLKKCHERGLIYKGLDAMPWCPRCGTGISEQERREGYRSVEDESVYVRFPLIGREAEYLLVWTTTPWTLAANVACAVHPDLHYVKVRQGDAFYWIVRGRWEAVMKAQGAAKGGSSGKSAQGPSTTSVGSGLSAAPAEVVEEVRGSDLLAWEYQGPFDELPAQTAARGHHRVIPWSEVSDTDGTGIVHIAPGCGKEDFDLSKDHKLPVLAPIDEEGKYLEGYGFLSGQSASEVAPQVYDSLREKRLFYKAERYVHDYPHCWRCGTPLLFRAVDEWYISMSWREEIKQIARQIRWIPDYGLDLELDWLTNMGDWMISKKRYWGLALPIYACACGHFDVIGSKEELKARAIAGWDEFEGHSPHRPWVDAVQIACSKCGKPVSRIPDVGNPWLDAGIVPYSTVHYNRDRDYWRQWIPADLVLECFPGQFRNWFYALLAMSTMMEKVPPFKTLVGHALVRDEHGEEMHKSKGNAIWFDDAAEKMGVDVMRWIFCRQSPTINLNFGYTVGQQVEREVFRTLWNTYAFFTNYAIADRVDPGAEDAVGEHVPVAQRPEIDRWILSRLHSVVRAAHKNLREYNVAGLVRDAEALIEELSNWYVRRNRRRFWRSRGEDDRDKWAAYQTLHEVLVTLCKLLAPVIPFLTERMYQNLVRSWDKTAPESVHHCAYPEADEALIDESLNERMELVQRIVTLGHSAREFAGIRVRQPLSELRIAPVVDVKADFGDMLADLEGYKRRWKQAAQTACSDLQAKIRGLENIIADELNVKEVVVRVELGVPKQEKAIPITASLKNKFGKAADLLAKAIWNSDPAMFEDMPDGGTQQFKVGTRTYDISKDDVEVDNVSEWPIVEEHGLRVALSTSRAPDTEEQPAEKAPSPELWRDFVRANVKPPPELEREGLARDAVRHVQQLRKEADLDIQDRIVVRYETADAELAQAIEEWADYIKAETLCTDFARGSPEGPGWHVKDVRIGKLTLRLALKRASS